MEKLSASIDVTKIDKNHLVDRSYENRDGETVTEKNLKIDLIPLKEEKFITEKDDWKLFKVGFVKQRTGTDTDVIIGEVLKFETKGDKLTGEDAEQVKKLREAHQAAQEAKDSDDGIDASQIPF